MKKSVRTRILEAVKALQEGDEKLRATSVPEPSRSIKIKAVAEYLDRHGKGFKCQEVTVRGLLDVILDQPKGTFKKVTEDEVPPYPVGVIVVPLSNPNCHNYTQDQPVMVWTTDGRVKALRMDGSVGNYLPNRTTQAEATRFATPAEAKTFVDALKPKAKQMVAVELLGSK